MPAQPKATLEKIMELLGFTATVEEHGMEDGILLDVKTEDSGRLIGRQGQTLADLQYIANRLIFQQDSAAPKIMVDVGGYRAQGRTADEARVIVDLAQQMQQAGAAAILLEAVPAEVSAAVVETTHVPVIGCGAGPACHGHVVVTHDMLNLTPRPPKFAPRLGDLPALWRGRQKRPSRSHRTGG